MIYVKNDSKVITGRIFVPKDSFYSAKKDNFILGEFIKNKDFCRQYVTSSTVEEMRDKTKRFNFDSYSLINSSICSEDVLNDFEIILDSDLPLEIKIKYLKKIDGFFHFSNFCKDVYPFFDLETVSTYKIDELRKALDVCSSAGVFTEASDIISSENITMAENNGKVLKLVRKIKKFNDDNDQVL